jgi:hypothetical protein
MRITRLLLSMAVAMMLIGFTATAQEKKEEPKPAMKTEAPVKTAKHHKKAKKTKMAHAKKKAMKEEKKEAMPAK